MKLRDYVLKALQDFPRSRSDDYYLLEKVLLSTAKENRVDRARVLEAVNTLRLFPFSVKTVFRDRADLQREFPELKDPAKTLEREALEEMYRERYSPMGHDPPGLSMDADRLDALENPNALDFSDLDQISFEESIGPL